MAASAKAMIFITRQICAPAHPYCCEAVERALADSGMRVINLGLIPTPALMYYALGKGCASIMVTGSHIPFDRNGYKLNTSRGELLKHHEGPIGAKVDEVRERIYSQPFAASIVDETGTLRARQPLTPAIDSGREAYLARYLDFFAGQPATLAGRRILVYQHSAVGRDLLVELLTRLGAERHPRRSQRYLRPDRYRKYRCRTTRHHTETRKRTPGPVGRSLNRR